MSQPLEWTPFQGMNKLQIHIERVFRRHVWDLIDKAKKGRIIVLTTHAMEEADMLGDRIGIMARGRLRCLGNGLRLKARFGSGYKMSISIKV